MDELQAKAVELIEALETAVPAGFDLAVSAVQAQAIAYILVGVVSAVLGLVVRSKIVAFVNSKYEAADYDDKECWVFLRVLTELGLGGFVIAWTFATFLNPGQWIAVFAPEYALVLRVLNGL